jgi:hypothetical protein
MANSSQANRWGGLAALISGLLILIWVITDLTDYDLFIAFVPAAVVLLFLSIPSVHRAQAGENGMVGKIGYWITMIAGGLFAILFLIGSFIDLVLGEDPEDVLPSLTGPLFGILFFGLVIGILLFGVAMLIAGIAPRLAALFFLLGLPAGLLLDFVIFETTDEEAGPGFYIGIPMFAIGLLWLGWWVWSSKVSTSSVSSEI